MRAKVDDLTKRRFKIGWTAFVHRLARRKDGLRRQIYDPRHLWLY